MSVKVQQPPFHLLLLLQRKLRYRAQQPILGPSSSSSSLLGFSLSWRRDPIRLRPLSFFFPSFFSEKTFHPAAGFILSSLLCGERNRRGSMCQRAYIDFNRTGVC